MKRSVWQGAASSRSFPIDHAISSLGWRFLTLCQCVVTLGISLQIASTLKPMAGL